jgi:acetyl esterase/lipase
MVSKPPLIVWIHGGAWRKGSKGSGGRVRWMMEHGYALADINYRLSQEAVFPAQIYDCKAAIRWLRAHAEKYGYDAARIGVAGSSAGGYLVALLGTSGGVKDLEGDLGSHLDQSSRVQAVCDMWGPTDFLQMGGGHNRPESPESQLIGGPIQENKAKVAVANPITYVTEDDPPYLLLHGDKDGTVLIGQSELLKQALDKARVPVEFHVLRGAGHGGKGFPTSQMNEMILAFFDKCLRPAEVLSDRNRFVSLFDGKTLNGWIQKNGTATYRVVDGTILGTTVEGSWNSFLCTEKEYSDFELEFEVKVDMRLNSGVQIRSKTREQSIGKGPNKAAGRVIGPQVEIESSGRNGAEAGYIYGEATGRGWLTPKDRLIPHKHFKDEQWNHYRIVAQGPRIRTWINSKLIDDLTDDETYSVFPKGFIGLQVHRIGSGAGPYQVRWRNIRIRELRADDSQKARSSEIKIFCGEPRLLIVHGYSTSAHWWAFLQRKIDRYMGGPDKRVVEVQLCNKGGTPIARWMDIETSEPSPAWKQMFTPMIQAEKSKRPVIVLCQQSLQGVYADRAAGIRSANDHERIVRGADVIGQYAKQILDDGAAAVVIGMHIYKKPMEPVIGNERLALAELMKRKPVHIFAGPDVWEPTSKQHPLAFDMDRVHPNYIGAEIMAHYWFEAILLREGLEAPDWSRQEMEEAITSKALGLTRDPDLFRNLLKKWHIISRRPSSPSRRPAPRSSPGAGPVQQRVLDRYDKDGDGKLNEKEQAEFHRAREQRCKKKR